MCAKRGGCQLHWSKKKRQGVTSALSEVWDWVIYHPAPLSIKGGNHEFYESGGKRTETRANLENWPSSRIAPFSPSPGGSVGIWGACTRACVCVYKCLNESQKRGKEDKTPKERGMVDNSSSSKAQMVSGGCACLWLCSSLTWRRAEKALREFVFTLLFTLPRGGGGCWSRSFPKKKESKVWRGNMTFRAGYFSFVFIIAAGANFFLFAFF